jgi:hypothetical protein
MSTYDVVCEDVNERSGDPCGFTSTGWPTKADRDARAAQHKAEHETGDPMPELADFTREG